MAGNGKKFISFDPTIHAGHLLTAITIIVSAAAIWFGTLNTVANHETALNKHEARMGVIEAKASAERERTDRKFDSLVQDNNQALNKLRDDMQGWFMALNDKLDRKADKR